MWGGICQHREQATLSFLILCRRASHGGCWGQTLAVGAGGAAASRSGLLGRADGPGGGEALDAGPLGVGRKELAGDEKEEGGRCPSLNFLGKQQAG